MTFLKKTFAPRLLQAGVLLLLATGCQKAEQQQPAADTMPLAELLDKQLNEAAAQYRDLAQTLVPKDSLDAKKIFPKYSTGDSLVMVTSGDWTSGFYPGSLWYLYEHSQDTTLKRQATFWTNAMEREQFNRSIHDIGFMMNCSYGNAYRLTQNKAYEPILMNGVKALASRFNPKIGLIKSWDHEMPPYPVIIDNMMNLEYLYMGTQLSGDSTYANIANTHALNTIKHHIRENGSAYQIVNFDTATYQPFFKTSGDGGYNEESSWARGNAWGLYGFTTCYRYTKNPVFLKTAQGIASFMLDHKDYPEDGIPFWDYKAPNIPNALRDASAAAIMASGLVELSQYVPAEEGKKYMAAAERIVRTLSTPTYDATPQERHGLLVKNCQFKVKKTNEPFNTACNFGDYYYLEALMRLKNQTNAKPAA